MKIRHLMTFAALSVFAVGATFTALNPAARPKDEYAASSPAPIGGPMLGIGEAGFWLSEGDMAGHARLAEGDVAGDVKFAEGDVAGDVKFAEGELAGDKKFAEGDVAGDVRLA
jgi:hypothetical protein